MRRPGLVGVLETVLYHESAEREAVERFYGDVLGLTAVARWGGGIAFRIGGGVLLLFDREQLALRAGPIADHGASGAGHACLQAAGTDDLEQWRELLEAAGVEILHDHDWDDRRSRPRLGRPWPVCDRGSRWPDRRWWVGAAQGRRLQLLRVRTADGPDFMGNGDARAFPPILSRGPCSARCAR